MAQESVIELLDKLDYDAGVKKRFIKKINGGLYESHQSFLSTPLLAILMLLIFEQNANIPDKMHLFYGKAFETLFHKHDAFKEQYDRARRSNLQIDEFEKVFSVFCLRTYVKQKFEFSTSELTKAVRESIKFERHETNPQDFMFDIEESVCLIMKEGASYFFIHRSFQEYFTALFLANCPESVRDDFISNLSSRYGDGVLTMLFDMASDQIEPSWVTSNCDNYLREVGHGKNYTPLQARWSSVGFVQSKDVLILATLTPGPLAEFTSIMERFYPTLVNRDPIKFGEIEEYVREHESDFDFHWKEETSNDNNLLADIQEVRLDRLPAHFLEEIGITEYCERQFNAIVELRNSINVDQVVKNKFLSDLLG